jgi:hypothetical protein
VALVWRGNGPGDAQGVFAQRFIANYGGMHPLEAGAPATDTWDPNGDGDEHGDPGAAKVGHAPLDVKALDAYFAHKYEQGDLATSFHSGVKGGRFGDTSSDELVALLAANGDSDLGDALVHVHRKGNRR